MVSSNPQTWTVPPLKISVFYMGGNHHLDHVQKIYHMYSLWKKLRQISGEICAKKTTRNGQKQQFRQNLWWLAPAFPDMSKNMALTTQLATLQASFEIAIKFPKGFLFLLYHPPTPFRPFKDEDFPGKSHRFRGSFLHPSKIHQIPHHFLQHVDAAWPEGWNGPRTLAPTRGEQFFGWRWDGNLGWWGRYVSLFKA